MVFFFYGPNTYASSRKLAQMVEAYLKKTGSDLGLERIDGAVIDASRLKAALTSMPFLVSSRLVIVRGLGQNKAVTETAAQLLPQIPSTTVAVFYETEVDQRTSYFKAMTQGAKVAKFELLTPSQLQVWIRSQVAALGGAIEPRALAMLVERTGDDQWRLEQEIQKLVAYQPTITPEAVTLMVATTPKETIFNLVDAIVLGQVSQALSIFRDLISVRTNEIYILSMITWQLRNLLLAKTAGNMSAPELSKRAGMSPYVASKMLTRRRQFSEEVLRRAYLDVIATDSAIKSGQGDPVVLIERLIYKLGTEAKS